MSDGFELENLRGVQANIHRIFQRKQAALFALCRYYHAKALQDLQSRQGFGIGTPGGFWTNQTGQAIARAFGKAFQEAGEIGWLLAHGVDYGVYLELANDRRFEALRPIVAALVEPFLADVKRLYEG